MRILGAAFFVFVAVSSSGAQETCESVECRSKWIEQQRRELDLLLCEFREDSVERHACKMRLTPMSVGCSSKPTPPEQIKCLEDVVEGLVRMLPAMIAEQVRKELEPKVHR